MKLELRIVTKTERDSLVHEYQHLIKAYQAEINAFDVLKKNAREVIGELKKLEVFDPEPCSKLEHV